MPVVRLKRPKPKLKARDIIAVAKLLGRDREAELFRCRIPSLWQFWKHGITSSLVGTWLECREQAKLYYVDGWTPLGSPLAIEYGSCCHWILERVYGTAIKQVKVWLEGAREKAMTDWIKKKIAEYENIWKEENPAATSRQLEQQELVYGLAETVLPVYLIRWSGDFLGQYLYPCHTTQPVKWESLEELFHRKYRFPDGRILPVRGRRDGVFLDKRGKRWVFDTKCLSLINNDDILDMLPVNFQQMLYLWVASEESKERGVAPPAGCIMNVIRRPGHRRAEGEKLPHFLQRISNDVRNPKKFDHNFIRYEMAITQGELAHWKRTRLDPILEDMRGWWEGRHPHYPTDQHAITKYGRAGLFLGVVKGEFSNCFKRVYPFSELKEV